MLTDIKKERPECMPRLSHRVRKMQRKDQPILLLRELIDKLIADPLPSFIEQEDNFLLWLGNELREGDPAGNVPIDRTKIAFVTATVGAFNDNSLFKMISDLRDSDFVELTGEGLDNRTRMKKKGWQRYEEIRRSPSQARLAFMAMPFGNTELDHVYANCLKDAVKETGFELRRLDEGQPAGLIDDQLRVRISSARFVIAELTTENQGVYWEAGFAEGLGRPVIYTCEESKFKELKTHFDTNHHLTVPWAIDNLQEAAKKLKATIRATLPAEAKQSDD